MNTPPSKNLYLTSEYLSKNPTWHEQDSAWKARQIKQLLVKYKLGVRTISEIGCGAGGVLLALYKEYPEIEFFGYEISPSALELAKKKQNSHINFSQIQSESQCNFADLMLCIDVLEHVEDCYSFLRNVRSLSQWKVFHIPLEINVLAVLRGNFVEARENIGHIHLFDTKTALSVLRETGYEIVDFCFTPGYETWPCNSFKSKIIQKSRRFLHEKNPDLLSKLIGGLSLLVLAK